MMEIIVGLLVYGVWITILLGIVLLVRKKFKGSVDVVVGMILFWVMLLGPILIFDTGDYWGNHGLAGLLPFFLVYEVGSGLLLLF